MKKILSFIVAAAFILSACDNKKESAENEKPIVRIGIIWPLSGEVGHMGASAKAALKLFAEDEKTKNSKYDYNIVLEDNQLNPAKSALLAKKLIDVDKVDAIVTVGSNVGNAVSPLTERAKVLHMAIASAQSVAKGRHNFLIDTPPNKEAEKMIAELERRDVKSVALVTQNQGAMLAFTDAFKKLNKNITILSEDYINDGERDYRLMVVKILNNNPDMVVSNIYIPEISIFIKQLKEAKPDIRVTSMESFSYPEDKTLFEGYWFIDGAVAEKSFMERFKAVTGSEAVDYSDKLYASLELLRDSFDALGNDKPEVINHLVSGRLFDTAIGKVSFNPEGIIQSEASLKIIKDGKAIVLEE